MSTSPATQPPLAGSAAVLELPGLYGPFSFPEKLLQKIWSRRAFADGRATTTDGRRVTVVHPGKWNLLGGPDFKNARLRFDAGPEIAGDIELHLHAHDWSAHQHARDPAYDGVVLHVVLFVPAAGYATRGARGEEIPVLVLLPLLHHDLEEYAADDAVELLANRPAAQIVELLSPLSGGELNGLLAHKSADRWRQKVHYAQLRIARLGWEEACHQTALEILGYRFNRAPMLRLAGAFPLRAWDDATLDLEAVFQSAAGWSLQGLRPANQPRLRLRQYARWVRARPDWPARLVALGRALPKCGIDESTGATRRVHQLSTLRERWSQEMTGGAIRGTRFDNLMCDGFFPLLAAKSVGDVQPLWFHWFPGDVPPLWRQALRQLEVFAGRESPVSHGPVQGLLGWLIERERPTPGSTGRSA